MICSFKNLINISGVCTSFPSDSSLFVQCHSEEAFKLSDSKPDILNIVGIKSSIKVSSSRIITALKSQGVDGHATFGLELIIYGEIENILEYISDTPEQSVLNTIFSKPFTSCILLDDRFTLDSEYEILPCIEDIFIHQQDKRNLYINVMFIVTAIPYLLK